MADSVVRQDIIELGFDTNLKDLIELNQEIDDIKKSLTGGIGDDAFSDMQKDVKNATKGTDKLQNSVEDLAGTSLNKVNSGLKTMGTHLNNIANKACGMALTGLKKIAGISFKALVAGIGAAAVGVGTLIAKSTQAFADYEQLKGGVETLFKDSAGTVTKYANDAYKTAGLSANAYMENVTGFSASLISSCGGDTAEAAKLANTAITDMADNANKMGTDMGSLQYAYQGFAKQNYTMLDNLKLGYGGTKEEMARLIKDAAKIDKSVDANSMSFGNIVKAINAVQKDMGIYGATADEAEKTVTGSLNAMKASWGNLLTAIGSGENLDQCFDNMIKSAETFAGNLMPVVERAFSGMGTVIEKLSPIIAEKLPSMLQKFLPPLISAAGTLIGALVKELPAIIKSLIPAVKEAAAQIIKALYEAFTGKEMSGDAFNGVKSAIDGLISVLKIGGPIVIGFIAAFKTFNAVKSVVGKVQSFASSISNMSNKISGGLANKMSDVAGGMSKTGQAAKTNSTNMLSAAKSFMMIGAAVLMVAIGFGILAFSSIALANAGWGAIAVMLGMVVALVALGYGMLILLKSLSSIGAKATQGATAMLLLGVAMILVAAGFAILAFSAIALANAGGAAIAVFFGMIIAVAALAVVVAVLGSSMLTGAIGFLVFGAAVLMVGAGFMLMGVGALLAATALGLIVGILPQLVQHGLSSALSIAALGAALGVFAIGAGLAGAAVLLLAAGMLAFAVSLLAVVVSFTLLTALTMVFAASLVLVSAQLIMITAMTMLLGATLLLLVTTMAILTPMVLLFSAALLPISAAMLILTPTTVLFTATMAALMAVFVVLSPLALIFSVSMVALAKSMKTLAVSAPLAKSAFKGMPTQFTKMIVPAGLLAKAITPLSEKFAKLSVSATNLLKAITKLSTGTIMLSSVMQSGFTGMVVVVQASTLKMLMVLNQSLRQMESIVRQTNLSSAGAFMISGLIRGMNSKKAAAISTARSIAQAINREYRKVQDINSPSGEWENYGAYQIQGDINGMEKKMPQLKTTVQKVGESAMPYAGHYTPDNTTSYTSSRKTEYNSYSPQFNFTASGSGDDRTMLRKMKRMFEEAWREMLEDYESKTPQTQEV